MPRALLALGANEGDRGATFTAALRTLSECAEVRVIARSRWCESVPLGGPSEQAAFLNGASLIETTLAPHALWELLAATELRYGRHRAQRWGPRTLDLDLLLYGEEIIDDDVLSVPHPRLVLRRFVLEPAAEVAAEMLHPVLGRTLGEILRHVHATPQRATIAGGTPENRERLAARLSLLEGVSMARGPRQLSRWRAPSGAVWSLTCDEERPPVADKLSATPGPRLVIELGDVAAPSGNKPSWARTRWADGLVVIVDQNNLLTAVEQASLALQGLSDPDGAL